MMHAIVPRSCHVTGDIGIHDIAWAGEELWAVSTRFSCLCTLTRITASCRAGGRRSSRALAAEDRCHINGVAMVAGRPQFVTALGESDTPGAGGRAGPQAAFCSTCPAATS